ncbi:hypothetical protein JCM15415_18120 [Methanobacterium movens]
MNWTFAINKDFYFGLKENTEIKWNSAKEVRKGDIILIYTGAPYSSIGFILKAITNPFEDPEIRKNWKRPAIMVEKLVEIPNAIKLSELKENSILQQWGAVKLNFRGSHFKMTDEEWEEMKKLILEKNPELKNEITDYESHDIGQEEILPEIIGFYDLNAGRAHIVRDLCYLLSENDYLSENELFDDLRKKVDDDDYWKAYFSRSNENTSPQYSLNSSRTLGLVEKTSLKLTELGEELVQKSTPEELFTYNFGRKVKRFFFKLATSIPSIKCAMQILRKKRRLRFYAPTCKETNRVTRDLKIESGNVICESEEYDVCKTCDKDFISHMKRSSLPFETLLKNKEGYGFVFWMCSRVTPMHLTGTHPFYFGTNIYWDDEAEEELGELIELLENETKIHNNKPILILKKLFQEYETFYQSEVGQKHAQKYDLERAKVKKYYDLIEKEPETVNNISEPPINYLLPIKEPSVAPAAVGSITAYGYTDEDLPDLTLAVHRLIKDIINEINEEKQKEIIQSFKSGPYSKGFRSAILTPTLYYMDPEFLLLNKKTVDTYHFISNLLGKEDKISVELTDYIDNNQKLRKFLEYLSEVIPDLTFEKFDEFCHWMCYAPLGNYARDPEKYGKWLKENFPTQSEYGIRELFEIILKKYYNARINKEPVKGHELSKVFSKIPKTMEKIVNIHSITDYKHDYRAYSKFQGRGSFFKQPWTLLYDDKFKDKNSFYILLIFPENVEGAYLSLNISWGHYGNISEEVTSTWTDSEKKACLRKKASELRSKIISESPADFEFDFKNHPWQDTTIIGKYYNANDLPGEEVIFDDLIKLTELHNRLIDVFLEEPRVLTSSFSEYLKEKKFLYTPELVENFLLSLSVKPFVILTGSSGTGKTKIAQLFAEYLQQKNKGDYVIIPVGANWSENRHLMGFYNVITRDYEPTPALDLIIDAHNNPGKTYFLILDEMNLSHVERYFSDFLSAMESGKEIELYSKHKAEAIKNKIIPQKLKIPDNLLVVGTVNVDETTYMFSPKVLDRANTIEFTTYPANDYIMCIIEHQDLQGQVNLLENPLSHLNNRDINIAQLKYLLTDVELKNGDELWPILAREIHTFQDTLKLAGFDFGFRVINEIIRFMYMAWLYEGSPPIWNNWERYFDAQIMQKMLPKIHGSQRELEVLLEKLFWLCYNGSSTEKPWVSLTLEEDKSKYPSSALKIQSLGRSLQEKRYASFNG